MTKLDKLLSIASEPFLDVRLDAACLERRGALLSEIQAMLALKNGFAAFESALVVFPTADVDNIPGLDSWNSPDGWRRAYKGQLPDDAVCFAQDLFGGQFAATNSRVIKFDPETGEISTYADSLLGWAVNLLSNYAEDTGWPLAHEWQIKRGPISPNQRLLPKQPFVLGGDFVIENLKLIDASSAMEKWGILYKCIRSIPDGEQVALTGWIE